MKLVVNYIILSSCIRGDLVQKKKVRKTDYNNLKPDLSALLVMWGKGAALIIVISFLFYKSVFAVILLFPLLLIFIKNERKNYIIKRKKNLQKEFKEGVVLLLSGIEAGYSIENAFADACEELRQMYQKETDIEREFRLISRGVKLNEPIENLLLDFAERSGVEDVKSFADVFVIAKRRGGDMIMILKSSINTIQEKLEVKQEIDTILSGKRLEQNIMSVVPIGILVYVNFTSPEFLESLYGNFAGVIVMSVCLVLYGIAYFVGKKIVEVEI